jgi:hypothetical protein
VDALPARIIHTCIHENNVPVVSGRKFAATAPMTFIAHSTMPTVTFEADEMTMKGEQKAPNLEKATHIAWPTVRMSVEYSSGVVTQVAFCTQADT